MPEELSAWSKDDRGVVERKLLPGSASCMVECISVALR